MCPGAGLQCAARPRAAARGGAAQKENENMNTSSKQLYINIVD